MKQGISMLVRPSEGTLIGLARRRSRELIHPPSSVLGDFYERRATTSVLVFYKKVDYKLKYISGLLYII